MAAGTYKEEICLKNIDLFSEKNLPLWHVESIYKEAQ